MNNNNYKPNWVNIKQWPLAPNLRKWWITRANVSNASQIFPEMTFGECGRVWRVRAKQVGKCGRVWRVRAKQVGECRRIYRVRAKQVGECRRKQDRSFYAQITYFICIKRSSLHSLNSPNSPNSLNSCKSCQTCLSRVWRVWAKWLANVGQMYRVQGKWLANVGRMYRVRPIFQNGHFGEYLNSPKLANFWRVLEFNKFAGEWPLLNLTSKFKKVKL